MIKISEEKALLLHKTVTMETGGLSGVRDEGLLISALQAAYATFDGIELFPSIEEKAAKLGFSLISNHAFLDGNKRIGIFVTLVFLEVNGVIINPSNEEVVDIALKLAEGSAKYEELLNWINLHKN